MWIRVEPEPDPYHWFNSVRTNPRYIKTSDKYRYIVRTHCRIAKIECIKNMAGLCVGEVGAEEYLLQSWAALDAAQCGAGHRSQQ